MLSLSELTPSYKRQFVDRVKALDPAFDNEEPDSFAAWLVENNAEAQAPYGTSVLVDHRWSLVLGTGSLFRKDRGAEEYLAAHGYAVTGILGGVQIFRTVPGRSVVRGLGLGTYLCSCLDTIMENTGGLWALFTDNPVAARIYVGLGFRAVGLQYDGEEVFVKDYDSPAPAERN